MRRTGGMQRDLVFVNDLDLLCRTARDVGLAEEGARRLVWPLLCRVDPSNPFPLAVAEVAHVLTDQVYKDVHRSMFLAEPDARPRLRRQLRTVCNRVLDAHSELSYYQGFHDVASTILLVCKKTSVAQCVMERLATGPLRPLLAPDLSLVTGLLQLLFPIIKAEDAKLYAFLERAAVQPFFALPWVLTWFSHSVSSFATVARLFDFFLASDGTMPLFFSAAIVLWCRPHLLDPNEPVECEYSAVHSFFSKLFADIPLQLNLEPEDLRLVPAHHFARMLDADLEILIQKAIALRSKHAQLLTRECAKPFVASIGVQAWSELPAVRMEKVPRNNVRSIESLRYRFEGVARARRGAMQRRFALRTLSVAALVSIVWFIVSSTAK